MQAGANGGEGNSRMIDDNMYRPKIKEEVWASSEQEKIEQAANSEVGGGGGGAREVWMRVR